MAIEARIGGDDPFEKTVGVAARPNAVAATPDLTGDYNWVGGVGVFSDGADWLNVNTDKYGTVPRTNALAAIESNSTISGNGSVGQLNVEDGATDTSAGFTGAVSTKGLFIDDGASLTTSTALGKFTVTANFTVNPSGALTITDDSSFKGLGINFEGGSKLDVTAGGKLTCSYISGVTVVVEGSGSSVTCGELGSSSLTLTDDAIINDSGTADVGLGGANLISDGAKLTTKSDLTIANATISTDAQVTSGGHLYFYVTGTSLAIESGAKVTGAAAVFNDTVTASGVGTSLSVKGLATIGDYAVTTLTFEAGAHLQAGSAYLGSAAQNSLIVSGKSANAAISGEIDVGRGGLGRVFVEDGATAQVGSLVEGDLDGASSATGTLIVSGAGASLLVRDAASVGWSGTGNVTIAAGGVVTADEVWQAGVAHAAVSAEVVTGAHSALKYATTLIVGASGKASLAIESGGLVAPTKAGAGTIEIGEKAGAVGAVVVEGAASALEAANLAVGGTMTAAGGAGDLTIDTGSSVTVSKAQIWSHGEFILDGGVISTKSTAIAAGGELSGHGTVAGAITDKGSVEAVGGGLVITGAVANTGVLAAVKGDLTVDGAVSGTGSVQVNGGTADFASTFGENVDFTGSTGVLELAKSQSYSGTVTGFSKTASLDLRDIAFVSGGKTTATFKDNGHKTGGVLTVTNGTHTTHVTLAGDYVGVSFTAVSDGHGGVTVTDPPADAASSSVIADPKLRFIAAMAGLAGTPSPVNPGTEAWRRAEQPMLAATRMTQIA